jgi:serine/threonine-protein kinase
MGTVYKAEQISTGSRRAIKTLLSDLEHDALTRERFRLEARVSAIIDSDHVVEVIAAGVDERSGLAYLVMELLVGETLEERLEREGILNLDTTLRMLRQAGHALERAHAQSIVHRDLKPSNLFLAEPRRVDGHSLVKILDFGLMAIVGRPRAATMPVGTPLYMSPEQCDRHGAITPACDVWALGLIAFECLTGACYWTGADEGISTLLREIMVDPLEPASARARQLGAQHELTDGFDQWFGRCVARDHAHRYADAGACIRGLEALVLPSEGARWVRALSALGTPNTAESSTSLPRPATRMEVISNAFAARPLAAVQAARVASASGENDHATWLRRTSARECIASIERALLARLKNAIKEERAQAALQGLMARKRAARASSFGVTRLVRMAKTGVLPSLSAIASLLTDALPTELEPVRDALGVRPELTGELQLAAHLRNVLAHQTEYEVDLAASFQLVTGFVGRSEAGDIDVSTQTVELLEWLAVCILERTIHPRPTALPTIERPAVAPPATRVEEKQPSNHGPFGESTIDRLIRETQFDFSPLEASETTLSPSSESAADGIENSATRQRPPRPPRRRR